MAPRVSKVADYASRSYGVLRMQLPLRYWALWASRMTATPPKYQLWHPTRGISFSPIARSPNLAPQDAAATNEDSSLLGPDGLEASSSYQKLESLSLSSVKRDALDSDGAASKTVETVAEHKTTIVVNKSTASEGEEEDEEDTASDKPPVSALPFKMAEDLFYAAKSAPPGSVESFWSYAQYRGVTEDGPEQKVRVHYCRSIQTMERVCKEHFMDEKILGFDLEWFPEAKKWQGVKKNVSLIQLASPSRIGLFHVALFPDKADMVGPSFRAIMESSEITKVGVAIKGDATRLRNFLGIDSKGLFELSHLYKLVTYSANGQQHEINKRLVPLATQVEHYLRLPLFKGQDVRSSDWTKALDMSQVVYSASDAYAGLQLYATLEHHRKQLDPCPPTPHHAELNLPIRLADDVELAANDDPIVDATEVTELEAIAPDPAPAPAPSPAKPRRRATPKTRPVPKDSRVEIAEDRVAAYLSANPKARATIAQLRAYYMWHSQGLHPDIIAKLLRDPPLKTATVSGYVLAAVQLEKLPADEERLYQEVLPTVTPRARALYISATI